MEDFGKIIVSIIAAIIYFIYSSNKNIKQQQTRRPGTMPSQEQPAKPQKPPTKVSFEELLKELETKIQEQLPQPPAEESIEDRKNRNKKNIEPVSLEKQFSYDDKYQQTPPPVATPKPNRLTKPQTPPPAVGSPKVNKEIATEVQHPIAALLTDANQLRNAFVLSEIFNRKW
ncbi:hypothetical protein [Rhodoflexus caldus]|uniref:hypothetical protein n=1 Tax=Rhodoflexus caldus TaxID=2891236 RepID=UPI00202A003D|nr:hypothetical protein [Rhodoflexus caldus]